MGRLFGEGLASIAAMAHCATGNCNSQANCPCTCGNCNVAARVQLVEENRALKEKIDDLADAFGKYLKQDHPRTGGI